jgi:hypothetical protein
MYDLSAGCTMDVTTILSVASEISGSHRGRQFVSQSVCSNEAIVNDCHLDSCPQKSIPVVAIRTGESDPFTHRMAVWPLWRADEVYTGDLARLKQTVTGDRDPQKMSRSSQD